MYTYPEVRLQNKQDAFSAMFMFLSRSILTLCGERKGEGIIREAVRRAGFESGTAQLKKLRAAGVPTNLHNLFNTGLDYLDDPRVRCNVLFDQEDRQIWEVYTCPLANFWNRHSESKIGSLYCEEYQYARLLAFTEDKGQLNLSKILTSPCDNFCRFSMYFREANVSTERGAESFTHAEVELAQLPDTNFDDGVTGMTLSIYFHLLGVATEREGPEGTCAIAEGLKKWAVQTIDAMQSQAVRTLKLFDTDFAELNFPMPLNLTADVETRFHAWTGYEALKLLEKLVLQPLKAALL